MREYLIFSTFCILKINTVFSVPVEYCHQPLNRSDCNLKPTAVFSYYKPGSRCEIQIWRGCPTFNKFDNEIQCSDLCIGRLDRITSEEDNIIDLDNRIQTLKEPTDSDTCSIPLNTEKCTDEEVTVYTYKNNSCIPETWKGCPSENKFTDEESCEKTCVKVSDEDWKKELEALPDADIKEIDNILDDLDKNIENLNLKGVVEITTPVVTEVTTMDTTVSVTTKVETTSGTTSSDTTTLDTSTSETSISGTTTLATTTSETTTSGTTTTETTTSGTTKLETITVTDETTTIDDFQEVVLTKREGKGPK